MKLEFSYGMASLEIDRVMGEHSGKYTCIAYNEVGEATTECMVRVQGNHLPAELDVNTLQARLRMSRMGFHPRRHLYY